MKHIALISALSFALCTPSTALEPIQLEGESSPERGKVHWFDGTLDEALAYAARKDKIVMIEFWADWCGWCKQHEAENLQDRKVASSLDRFVCVGADLSMDKDGAFLHADAEALMKRFMVRRFPTLVFLSSDGEPEDIVSGYLPAKGLLAEVDRIARGHQTVSDWKARMDAAPDDVEGLEARYQYALKLDSLGDQAAYFREIAFIREADPAGTSLPMRRINLHYLTEKLWGCMRDPDIPVQPDSLAEFLADETEPELLCNAWLLMAEVQNELGHPLESKNASRKAWNHAPDELIAPVGNSVAWAYWSQREALSSVDKRFALRVALRATRTFEKSNFDPFDRASYYDTLACCYFLNGKTSKAIEWMSRCVEIDPANKAFVDRLEQFRSNR